MILTYVYLGLSLLLFFCTLGVLFPRAGGRLLTPLWAIPAMLLSLAIPQFILLGLALTLVVAWLGGLQGLPGRIGLGLHLISWALLLYYLRRMGEAYPLLGGVPVGDHDQPFCEHLPDEERIGLAPGRISYWPSVALRSPARADIEVVRDIVFREVDGIRLRLDVYRPRRRKAPLQAAMYIHGGGWILGSRRQSPFLLMELAREGFVVFAISYRFAPRFPLPAAIIDCKAALCWIHEHAGEFGGRPGPPIVLGGSAGGHLAAMMALTANDSRFQPGFSECDTRVGGAVVIYGVSDFEEALSNEAHPLVVAFLERYVLRMRYRDDPERVRLVQPLSHVRADAPPILLVHGEDDGLVPIEQSRRLYEGLREAGAPHVYLLEVPGALHAFEVVPSPLHQRATRVILRFLHGLRPA